ncbi:vesicular-fusion protein SEC18 [Mycena olivaceomarginata]|nr:vesicular-fusion protein SEC18 [Mycena olivaceomarginata]
MSRNYTSLPSGPRAGARPPPPQSMQYNAPPAQYNDPPSASFEKRGYDKGSPSNALALSNRLVGQHVLCKGQFPVTVHLRPGCIGASAMQRQWIGLAVAGDTIPIEPLPSQPNYLQSLDLEVGFLRKTESRETYSADELVRNFLKAFNGIIVAAGEYMIFDYTGRTSRPNGINIKSSAKKAPPNAILAPNFKFEDMGIGGLDTEFSEIFRLFAGLLLHGPPGTGKTLIARQIGKMLKAHEPKIVNGPEILSKFVGASEENIRKLFEDAEKEYKEKGDESELHIIIFDELDAIFKQRGSTNSGTGVGDSVVNQLYTQMDGDMIDEALLRPGRLEVHMEISLPDEKGRHQILNIHTAKMRTNRVMDEDNFSGAELNGLIKSATSFAFNRHVKVGTMAGISDDVENLRVNRGDFLHALDEVHPAFGVSEEELQSVIQNGIIHYDNVVDELLRSGTLIVEQVRSSKRAPVVNVLLHGPPGSGKTALAAAIAQASQFPFIKLITPDNMISAITKVFADSYKSPLSVVVVDNIERLIDWSPMGARFSNPVLQALLVLIGKRPPKDRRLLVIATTSNRPILTDLGFADFNSVLRVPPVTSLSALEAVIREVDLFPQEEDRRDAVRMLRDAGFDRKSRDDPSSRLQIGIKKLLSILEMARQEPDAVAERLVTALMELDL